MTQLGLEWIGKAPDGGLVTYWLYVGSDPMWKPGQIWVWGTQMRENREWKQVKKSEYDLQYGK